MYGEQELAPVSFLHSIRKSRSALEAVGSSEIWSAPVCYACPSINAPLVEGGVGRCLWDGYFT